MNMLYYFAYGSNMNETQMLERCNHSKKYGKGYINGYKLISSHYSEKWDGGVFSIIPDITQTVCGIIYEITPECLSKLDLYEGYPICYRRETIKVIQEKTNNIVKIINCIIYISNYRDDINISKKYLDFCIDASESHNINFKF